MSHKEFADRYKYLSTNRWVKPIDAKEVCRQIVGSYTKMEGEIHVGNSQIYATEHGIELVERWKLRLRNQAASVVQRWWREYLHRKKSAIVIQQWWRTILTIRAANKVKRWWKRKTSTAKTLLKVGQISHSVRIIQRTVRRWLKVQAIKRSLEEKRRLSMLIPEPVTPEPPVLELNTKITPEIVKFPVSPDWVDNNNCAKSTKPTRLTPSLISLQLSRTSFFYSEGVISIRRPPTV